MTKKKLDMHSMWLLGDNLGTIMPISPLMQILRVLGNLLELPTLGFDRN